MGLFDETSKKTSDDELQNLMDKLDTAFAEKLAELERLERGEEPINEMTEEQIKQMVREAYVKKHLINSWFSPRAACSFEMQVKQ